MCIDNRGAKIIRYKDRGEPLSSSNKAVVYEQSIEVFKECYDQTPKELTEGTDHTFNIMVYKDLNNYLGSTFKDDEDALNRYISMRARIHVDTFLDDGDLPAGEIGGFELRAPADSGEAQRINEHIENSKTFPFVNEESVRWVPKCK